MVALLVDTAFLTWVLHGTDHKTLPTILRIAESAPDGSCLSSSIIRSLTGKRNAPATETLVKLMLDRMAADENGMQPWQTLLEFIKDSHEEEHDNNYNIFVKDYPLISHVVDGDLTSWDDVVKCHITDESFRLGLVRVKEAASYRNYTFASPLDVTNYRTFLAKNFNIGMFILEESGDGVYTVNRDDTREGLTHALIVEYCATSVHYRPIVPKNNGPAVFAIAEGYDDITLKDDIIDTLRRYNMGTLDMMTTL